MILLQARDVSLRRGDRAVVSAASLTLAKGRVIGLIGPNGAGKSTFMRLLAGLETPDCGDIQLLDRGMGQISPALRARQLAFIPQDGAHHRPCRCVRWSHSGVCRMGRRMIMPPVTRPWAMPLMLPVCWTCVPARPATCQVGNGRA